MRAVATGMEKVGRVDHAVLQAALEQIHRRRADETRDEGIDRPAIQCLWRVDLLKDTALQDRNPVAHGQGFGLIVRHIDRRHAQLPLQADDFGAHLYAQLGIEV